MPTSENFELTQGTAGSHNFTSGTALDTDLMLLVIYDNGVQVQQRASAGYGGGDDQISVNLDANYVVAFPASLTSQLQRGLHTITYKLFKIDPVTFAPTELFNGTITVNAGAGSPPAALLHYNNRVETIEDALPDAASYREGDIMTVIGDKTYKHNGTTWEEFGTVTPG